MAGTTTVGEYRDEMLRLLKGDQYHALCARVLREELLHKAPKRANRARLEALYDLCAGAGHLAEYERVWAVPFLSRLTFFRGGCLFFKLREGQRTIGSQRQGRRPERWRL
jgi:hypothetical protein